MTPLWTLVSLILLRITPTLTLRRPSRAGVGPHIANIGFATRFYYSFVNLDKIRKAVDRAWVESYVQDVNLQLQKRPNVERLLVVLELGDAFSRGFRDEHGNRIQLGNSDKVSLPESVLTQLTDGNVSVPWQFIIQKVHRCDLSGKDAPKGVEIQRTRDDKFRKEEGHKERLSCASLDFRNQDYFIFLPRWMMDSLDLKPYDLVYLSHIKLPEAVFVRISPLEESFFQLDSPKAVLEEHLKHYSTLTRGAKITITHEGNTYTLQVLTIETEEAKDVECASIQDLDVSIDLVKTA